MKSEDTIYDDEKTQYDASQNVGSKEVSKNEEKKTEKPVTKKGSFFRKAGVGLGMGVLLGSTTSFITADAVAGETGNDPGDNPPVDPGHSEAHPAWSDGEVAIATGVSDDMSFSEAFSSARAEVGPGGAFEWHGNVYGTYTAEEWNNMSAEERQEYNAHFSWNEHSSTEPQSADDVEVVSVEGQIEDASTQTAEIEQAEVEVINADEVEVLGVMHDDETGANIGGLIVEDQEVILIDVDGSDDTFEYIASDLDGDGQITENEVADISDQHISVSQFESNAIGEGSLYASTDGSTDYANEIPEDYDMA